MPPTLTDLIILSKQAGKILRDRFGQQLQVGYKSTIDLVSDVDHHSERLLLRYIHENFPQDHIMSEESGERTGSNDHTWYVDPLDGTVNYVHGIPIYSVSIAY